jgi:hypothetical protein
MLQGLEQKSIHIEVKRSPLEGTTLPPKLSYNPVCEKTRYL